MAYDRNQATREFTHWSETYDRSILQWLLFGPSHRAMIRRIGDRYGSRPLRILDVGCGTGVFASRLLEAFPKARIWGIDLVDGMLRQGMPRWERCAGMIQPVQADSENLPFAAGSFDIVTCANSFHHYPDQARAVREMHRVLRTGGRLMLIDGYRDAPWGWFIYDVCVAGIEGAVHHCSAKRVEDLFASAGFGEIRQKVHRGAAPFLFTEAVALPIATSIPAPHFPRMAEHHKHTHDHVLAPKRDTAA